MDIIMVGIAGMIGGAIFVLTGPAIGLAGSAVILAFVINAMIIPEIIIAIWGVLFTG